MWNLKLELSDVQLRDVYLLNGDGEEDYIVSRSEKYLGNFRVIERTQRIGACDMFTEWLERQIQELVQSGTRRV